MCGGCMSAVSGNQKINPDKNFFPTRYSSVTGTDEEEYKKLLQEAHEQGYDTIGEYMDFLEGQGDTESTDKASKIKSWIDDGTIERTATTFISIFDAFWGAFGGGDSTDTTNNTGGTGTGGLPPKKEVPKYVWGIAIGVIVLVVMYLYVKSTKGKN